MYLANLANLFWNEVKKTRSMSLKIVKYRTIPLIFNVFVCVWSISWQILVYDQDWNERKWSPGNRWKKNGTHFQLKTFRFFGFKEIKKKNGKGNAMKRKSEKRLVNFSTPCKWFVDNWMVWNSMNEKIFWINTCTNTAAYELN